MFGDTRKIIAVFLFRIFMPFCIVSLIPRAASPMAGLESLEQTRKQAAIQQQKGAQVTEEDLKNAAIFFDSAEGKNLINELNQSSLLWMRIGDERMKMMIVIQYYRLFASEGLTFGYPPEYYQQRINLLLTKDPGLTSQPFPKILKTIAIIEYDLNGPHDKDTLAKNILPENFYDHNRTRLSGKIKMTR